MPADAGKETLDRMDKLRNASGPLSTAQIRGKMQKAMQEDAAVFRTQVTRLIPLRFEVVPASYISGHMWSLIESCVSCSPKSFHVEQPQQ